MQTKLPFDVCMYRLDLIESIAKRAGFARIVDAVLQERYVLIRHREEARAKQLDYITVPTKKIDRL